MDKFQMFLSYTAAASVARNPFNFSGNATNRNVAVETIDIIDDSDDSSTNQNDIEENRSCSEEVMSVVNDMVNNAAELNVAVETIDIIDDDSVDSASNQNDIEENRICSEEVMSVVNDMVNNAAELNAEMESDSTSNNTNPNTVAEMTNAVGDNVDNNMNENNAQDGMEETYDACENNVFEIDYDFSKVPHQITGSWKEFNSVTKNNFTRGCKWAPDGSCILSCSDDNMLRIFNLPSQLWDTSQWEDIGEMEAVVKISEGELIYDYSWYPLMNSSDPVTCCLASTSRKSTVHLWDGFTGELRCTYRSFNHMDEIATPHSLSFNADGQKLFCGFEKFVRIFNVDSPGRNFEERQVFAKKSGQPGIISCFAFTPVNQNISAAGSYQKTIGIYSEPSGELECLLEGQKGGVTQLQFSPDGNYLYSGGRKDREILCWDLRNLGTVLFSLRRSSETNQRMYFDVSRCGKYVVSGNQNGVISIWDTTKEPKVISDDEFTVMEPIQFFLGHSDCVNGVSLHPSFPLLCSSSGERKFPTLLDEEAEGIFSPEIEKRDNSLRLWWVGKLN